MGPTAVIPRRGPYTSVMSGVYEIRSWIPAGPLTAADISKIDMEVPFEISDGKLEIMTPPTAWHQYAVESLGGFLRQRYPYATGDVPLLVGDNGRRPDVVALMQTRDEVLQQRLRAFLPQMIAVAVEVISHDSDGRRDSVSVGRDRDVKFHEYAAAGIPEYWIVDEVAEDPTDASVEIYHLRDGHYVPVAVIRLSKLLDGTAELPTR